MIRKHPRRGSAHPFLKVMAAAVVLAASVVTAPAANATDPLVTQDLTTLTATHLADMLGGLGVTVSNVVYTGAPNAAGAFSGGGTGNGAIIGFDQGIVLSTGSVSNVVGPNLVGDVTTVNEQAGDSDLDGLLPSGSTQDAAVLSFDFVANASSVSFRYVFASDEYNEFVNAGFNDVFGFFVNGSDLGADCAKVDGLPVSIDTINGGSHPELFRNNSTDLGLPTPINTEMDGLTTVLLCQVPVVAGETNTMKLAIADVGDSAFDSNVFIEAGSLTTEPRNVPGAPTNVTAEPGDGSALVSWTTPTSDGGSAIDGYTVTCTATGNADDTHTASVDGTTTSAQVGGLTNGVEYTCSVMAHNAIGDSDPSGPSAPFTPSGAQFSTTIDTSQGGVLVLNPQGQDNLGTTGKIKIPPQPGPATDVVVTASLFGTPGEIDFTCGGNRCVGQGIQWAISDPSAIGLMKVVFKESPSLTDGADVNTANVYKDGVLIPNCGEHVRTQCISHRDITKSGGWRITFKTTGLDPRGRI
jgi:hypothetical protein